jgi:hypothetical protein
MDCSAVVRQPARVVLTDVMTVRFFQSSVISVAPSLMPVFTRTACGVCRLAGTGWAFVVNR